MEIAVLMTLILLNGLFAMSEIALVILRKSRLQRLADNGDKSAAVAVRLGEEPTQFLSTVQIGITAIGILNGIVGQAALAGPLAAMFRTVGLSEKASAMGATAVVVATVTYFSIVVGELVPKRLGQVNAEGIARVIARPVAALVVVSRPFVYLLSVSTDGILRLVGKKELSSAHLTEEDIHAMLVEGSQTGVIEKQEHEMVRNVFRLDDRQIVSLMTPRSEIVYLDVEEPFEGGLQHLIASDHSRFPVCRGGMQDILGVITAKRLLRLHLQGQSASISDYLLPAVYVPESLTGMKLLEQFRESGVQMVFIVDEYGEVLGLVTLQDVLECWRENSDILRDPEDVWAVKRDDGSWLLDGLIPVPELKDRLDLRSVPEEDKGMYHTLGGMMMWLVGSLPRTGDVAEWQGWRFEVVDLDGNRVDKVMATRLSNPEAKEDNPGSRSNTEGGN